MLKHSISHYGTTTGVGLPTPHPMTSSSHSGDTSLHRQHQHHSTPVLDPTRFLEGPTSHVHSISHSSPKGRGGGYLDQSYPGIHSPRLYLDTSRQSRGHLIKDDPHSQSSIHPKPNGSIYFSSPLAQSHDLPQSPNYAHQSHTAPSAQHSQNAGSIYRHGVLRSLSLLSILSLLLALNSLVFLLKIVWPLNMSGGGSNSEFKLMYEVTLCLAAMCLSINLCVLLVTSAQYFFAISGSPGSTSFLHKVTVIRGVAIAGFFLSIPLFLAAIVLYTFTHLSFAVPALVATACVGLAIIFGGCAMVYHVFTWQQEKTNKRNLIPQISPNHTIELSTLV